MKKMISISIADGILRGIIAWSTIILMFSERIVSDSYKMLLLVMLGIIISGISMYYTSFLNKEKLIKIIISYCFSISSCIFSFFLAFIYLTKPVSSWNLWVDTGPVGGIMIMSYLTVFGGVTLAFRMIFLGIYLIKRIYCFRKNMKRNGDENL